MTNTFPLLNQIDEGIHSESIDWNKNAFQTLLTSNLPSKTILYYAIDVGLRRVENSLYEAYLDVTTDALNDLSQFLLQSTVDRDVEGYLYEAKCQLLMYSAIAMIKLNMVRRRSTHDAKMACATICSLLLHQSKSYENPSMITDYSSCIRSMRCRYLKRIFIIVQWLPTLSQHQFDDLQTNHERYIALILDHLYPGVSVREQIQNFIDQSLLENNIHDDEAKSSGFVLIRRFPVFHQKIIDKHQQLMNIGLTNTLVNPNRKLICSIWTLCCMMESERISLGIISNNIVREHFSTEPIDFEQKPVTMKSLNECDVMVFLLLCAQQNVHLHGGESILHPYLLFSSAHLCTQQQKSWWQTAMEPTSELQTSSNEFLDHLATIRLDTDRTAQYPPKSVLLETARILFKAAQRLYEHNSKRAALSYEQYAIQYLQTAKNHEPNEFIRESNKSMIHSNKSEKFFFYYQKGNNQEQKAIEQCEKLARQCDELKLLSEPEPPRTSSPTREQGKDIHISTNISPVTVEKNLDISDSSLFATPPSNKSRDVDVQTFIQSPPSAIVPLPTIDETPDPAVPPYVDLIFSHMNHVNQWINQFSADTRTIHNDIQTIRIALDKMNRITSEMMYSTDPPT